MNPFFPGLLDRQLALGFALLVLVADVLSAQPVSDAEGDVGIGTGMPDPSAVIDVNSTTKGFLLPRMTTADRSGIGAPAEGLMVFNTDLGAIETWSDASGSFQWDAVLTTGTNTAWLTTGNAGLIDGLDNLLGTTDGTDIDLRTNNITAITISGLDQSVAMTGNVSVGGNLNADGGADVTGSLTLQGANSPLNVGGSDGTSGDMLISSGAGNTPGWADPNGVFWRLVGNTGTTAGTNFVGTADDEALHLYVDGGADNSLILNTNMSIQRDADGDARGLRAVDLQILRSLSNQVASGSFSTIGGGLNNRASGSSSTIGGGGENIASSNTATVGGGVKNTASDLGATVGGGQFNDATGEQSTVGGGNTNEASGAFSVIAGGALNTVEGSMSAVPGGRGLTLSGSGSFGFLGANPSGANNMTVSAADVAVFGNTDLWLANNDGAAGQLRFYEANSADGDFPDGVNYSAFRAGAQTSDVVYVLPAAAPTAGQVLAAASVSGSTVTLTWATAAPIALDGGGDTPTSIASPDERDARVLELVETFRMLRTEMQALNERIKEFESPRAPSIETEARGRE